MALHTAPDHAVEPCRLRSQAKGQSQVQRLPSLFQPSFRVSHLEASSGPIAHGPDKQALVVEVAGERESPLGPVEAFLPLTPRGPQGARLEDEGEGHPTPWRF